MKKKYMAVFIGKANSMSDWEKLDERTRKEREKQGIAAWYAWGEKNKQAIVENGPPLGKTKKVDKNGVTDTKNELTAYAVVEAESHEAAAKLFLSHPHFTIFPGDSIEVMECLDIPEMK
jgi:hypothetical protein